jgi:hypothetical protein
VGARLRRRLQASGSVARTTAYPNACRHARNDGLRCAKLRVFWWQNAEGAANQVRQAIEYLMDERGVINSKPSTYKSLHRRIKKYEAKDPKSAEILFAVKWLVNTAAVTRVVFPR